MTGGNKPIYIHGEKFYKVNNITTCNQIYTYEEAEFLTRTGRTIAAGTNFYEKNNKKST